LKRVYSEVVALRQAAAQCRRTIDGFWNAVKRYQPCLGNDNGREGMWKYGWRKNKWAVCKKEDVVRFKQDLLGHTEVYNCFLRLSRREYD
jgi:hypothetical protein